ncbi:MAG TPA: DUF2510 domain-containing protein [Actinomycetes bacterium]|nr:DUF2510 domain-containing protein [Actinomycetes bacterium]
MSAATDVVPGAGWYRDPTDPGLARWWDGSAWGPQTRPLPSALAAPAAAPPAPIPVPQPPVPQPPVPQPMIAVADPAPSRPPAAAARRPVVRRRGTPRLPRPSTRSLVAVALCALLAVGGWYAWTTTHSSASSAGSNAPSSRPAPPSRPFPSARVRLPRSTPSDLAGVPWAVDPVSRSLAAHVVTEAARGGHRAVASFYGLGSDRFFFIASALRPGEARSVSGAALKARLVSLLESAMGDPAQRTSLVRLSGMGHGSPPIDCVSGRVDGEVRSVCSWQNAQVRMSVARTGRPPRAAFTLREVLQQLAG